ncbi:HNH endonuclease signature motif containing protein [Microbacterium xylanilyticum]
MTNAVGMVQDPGVDPVDPVAVLAMVTSGLAATEASIIRLQAVPDAHLAVAQRLAEDLAAASGSMRGESVDLAARSVAAELAAVLHMSDRVVQGRMARAAELMTRYPITMQAFSDARINTAHVRLIQDTAARLDDEVRAEFEQAAVAACEGETPHRAKRIVERIAERLTPRSLTERHREAQEKRSVWREELPDGQKALGLVHSAAVIDGIYDRLTQQARLIKTANAKAAKDAASGTTPDPDELGDPDDDRTLDQLRADLCADTLLTGTPSGHDTTAGLLAAIQARVEVTIPAFTAMAHDRAPHCGSPAGLGSALGARTERPGERAGLWAAFGVRAEQPAELAGGQPIDTDTARLLAGGATAWERVLTHPITGAILAVDHYRPNADLRRLLHARDARCRFITCGLPPITQDLDHTIDAAHGGPTEEGNLGGLCRRHHVLKHQTAWTVKQLGAGVLEWTSPTGASYIDQPPPPVTFTIDEPDLPGPDPHTSPDQPPPF